MLTQSTGNNILLPLYKKANGKSKNLSSIRFSIYISTITYSKSKLKASSVIPH